jgi:hypothetical protein
MHLLIAAILALYEKLLRDRTHAEVGQIGAWLADISQAMEAKTK